MDDKYRVFWSGNITYFDDYVEFADFIDMKRSEDPDAELRTLYPRSCIPDYFI